uniref:Uncharacterized protein n=1 Tax=Anopheles maculatus TaxID=74869 RepID=A0A182T550_9DIPT
LLLRTNVERSRGTTVLVAIVADPDWSSGSLGSGSNGELSRIRRGDSDEDRDDDLEDFMDRSMGSLCSSRLHSCTAAWPVESMASDTGTGIEKDTGKKGDPSVRNDTAGRYGDMRSSRAGRYVSASDWSADDDGGVRDTFNGNFGKLMSECSGVLNPFSTTRWSLYELLPSPTPPPPPSSRSADDAPESLGVFARFKLHRTAAEIEQDRQQPCGFDWLLPMVPKDTSLRYPVGEMINLSTASIW